MKHKLKQLNEEAMEAMMNAGFSYSTAFGANWYIWNRLTRTYGEDTFFDEKMIYDYCLRHFNKDIFNSKQNQLTNIEKRYRTAFNNLLYFVEHNHFKKEISIINKDIPKDYNLLLNEYINECKDSGNTERTIENKINVIKRFIIESDFPNITKETISKYIKFKMSKISKITYVIDFRLIRKFLVFCIYKGLFSSEILLYWPEQMSSIQNKKIPSYYTDDEIRQLIASSSFVNEDNHLRNYSILLLIIYTGIRAKDVTELKLNNIDWHNNIIKFIQSKNKKEIIIPLLSEFGNPLVNYIKSERKSKYDFLYVSGKGNKLTSRDITTIINNYFLNSNIIIGERHYGAHALRHSLATRLINNNYSYFEVANTLGHANINSVYIYAKVDISNLRKCVLEAPYYV